MPAWLLVSLGGVVGALSRYYLGAWVTARMASVIEAPGLQAPVGTFLINASGSFVIGLVAMLAVTRTEFMTPDLRLLLAVGFCGAFTTFSTFSLETWVMIEKGHWGAAVVYVVASNLVPLVAVILGGALGRGLAT
jgi:CrcB protein